MKSHQILKTSENLRCSDKRMNSTLVLHSQRCEVHHGKLVDIFCQDHNEVCCGACVIIYHSSCLHKLYIPKEAKDADVMKEAKDAVIIHMCSERRHLFANLKAQKSNLSSQITKSTNKIINHFKTLESNLLSELEDKVTTIEEDVQLDINDTDKVISTLQHENRLLSKHIAETFKVNS
ncbi:tripartite motif-containing 13-like [Ruditapes philippinarum]|uniref:tripartite motif-containing 13-like n=1 Tax=Ruditapes philippinarum TaxID=129788 RepID=UPI00295B2106|nr:tripartite motif-containing 13-like [Ruditapes philippinarum]